MLINEIKNNWNKLTFLMSEKFGDGEEMDLDAILFVIGVQELGFGYKKYKKNEKVDILHVAICRLLEPYGYYEFSGIDEQGWPHFKALAPLPFLKAGEQTLLMKEAIVEYAIANDWLND